MNSRHVRVVFATALLATTAFSATAQAQPVAKTLVVTGSHSSSAIWIVDRSVEVDPISLFGGTHVVDRRGATGGVVVHQGDKVDFFVVNDRAWSNLNYGGSFTNTLKPGRYTVTLIADRPTTVRIQLKTAARSYRIRTTRAAHMQRVEVTPTVVAGIAHVHEDFTVSAHDFVLMGYDSTSGNALASNGEYCVAPAASPCPASGSNESAWSWGPFVDPSGPTVYSIPRNGGYICTSPLATRPDGPWYTDLAQAQVGTTGYLGAATITADLTP